jgi:tetratricopeptide (TPR) repeat protein
LQEAVADLHSLVGWSLHDLGRHTRARLHFTKALSLGSATDDRSMVAAALYRLGRVSIHNEQPDDALRAFQLGTMAAQDAGSYADLARLHVSSAWAYALMGQPDRMHDSFARAEHELGRIDADNSPQWASAFVKSGDWDGIRAISYIILARKPGSEGIEYAEKAVEVTSRVVPKPADGRPERSRIFDRIIDAAARIRIGDREAGISTAHDVIDRVEQLRSIRAIDRLSDLDRAAALQPDDETREIRQRISRLRLT